MSKRAVLYARVSTDEQADKGYSLPTQLEATRKYAAEHGYTVVGEFKESCSGAIRLGDRPHGSVMLAMLERGEAGTVIVYTSDRLSRNLAHSLILREEWQRAQVELHYVNRGKSEDTPESRMTENIEGVFNEYWREKIKEASRRGRVKKAESGRWEGSGAVCYGYERIGKGDTAQLVIVEDAASIIRRIYSTYLGWHDYKRIPMQGIAKSLMADGVEPPKGQRGKSRGWYLNTVRRILQCENYIGRFGCMGHTVNMPRLAIIDRETFEAAQRQREKNIERSSRNRKHDYLLSSHLTCSCGLSMRGHTVTHDSGIYLYYGCGARAHYQYLIECHERFVKAQEADTIVWRWLEELLTDDEKLDKGITEMIARRNAQLGPMQKRLETVNSLIEKSERKIKRLTSLAGDANDDEIAAEYDAQAKAEGRVKAKLIAERDTLAAQLAQGEITEADRQTIKATAALIHQKLGDKPTFEQKRQLLELLDLRVKLQREGDKRWLFVTCGLRPEGTSLPLGNAVF